MKRKTPRVWHFPLGIALQYRAAMHGYVRTGVMTNVDVRADLVAANKYGLTGTVALVEPLPPVAPGVVPSPNA